VAMISGWTAHRARKSAPKISPASSALTVSSVNVVDRNTITAAVSVPNGGSASDPVWDVRVGPAVLRDGFTVIR
jgi:hypothetical protein